MGSSEGRKKTQIRDEIRSERQQLDEAVAALVTSARQTARTAGSALAAFGTVLVIARQLRRRSR